MKVLLIGILLTFGSVTISFFEWPDFHENEHLTLIKHSGYSLLYDEYYEQAQWVAYELDAKKVLNSFERTNKFLKDPSVPGESATNADYQGSGYDRGHLAPAADMGYSEITMKESFFYSNMSPQVPGFNRGIWKKLEEQVRQWASDYHQIFIVTGPVLRQGLPTMGPNEVAIPEFYYKVVLDTNIHHQQMIAFLLPNESSHQSLSSFVISTNELEKITGINFFPKLENKIEEKLESKSNTNLWNW